MTHEHLFKRPIEEILFNALIWGNQANPRLPVHVKIFEGSEGRLMRVTDAGNGFDYRTKIQQYLQGERYWQNKGCGLETLAQNPFIQVSYDPP